MFIMNPNQLFDQSTRLFQPSMESFFAVAKEEADPEACIEDEYK